MGQQVTVALTRGILLSASSGGLWVREALLRQLDGHDERSLAELSGDPRFHQNRLAFLDRMVRFEGIEEPVSGHGVSSLLRKLSIGDRTAILLHIHRLEFGDTLDCTVVCPRCTKNMSVELSAAKLLDIKHPEPAVSYRVEAGGFTLQVRPLTISDQYMLVSVAQEKGDLEQALTKSCIVYSDRPLPEKLPVEITAAIESKLMEIDPMSDITLALSCPECKHEFGASLDVEDFVFRKLAIARGDLESEVHTLAFNYHWSENEILSLPVRRRKKYISLINSTLMGEKT